MARMISHQEILPALVGLVRRSATIFSSKYVEREVTMRYILRRLGFYLVAFWAALTIDFFLPHLLPGDPAATILNSGGVQLQPAQVQALREALGLSNAPLPQQYVI